MAKFVKNIFTFMKRAVSPVSNNDCSTEISKTTEKSEEKPIWTSQDKYLENKYKRVKIYNGETEYTQNAQNATALRNKDKNRQSPICPTSKRKRNETDDESGSSSEDETKIDREKCINSNVRKYKKCPKNKKRLNRDLKKKFQEENDSSTETESESLDEDTFRSPKRNLNKKSDGDTYDRLENIYREMVLTVREKCLKKRFEQIEKNANALWIDCSTHLKQCIDCNVNNKQWKNLNSIQKLPFYWAAISGDFLKESPFENFLRFYLDEKGFDDKFVPNKEFKQHVQTLWHQMEENEKIPFVMESFMYRVSLGKVDMRNDQSIKNELNKIFNRTGYL